MNSFITLDLQKSLQIMNEAINSNNTNMLKLICMLTIQIIHDCFSSYKYLVMSQFS